MISKKLKQIRDAIGIWVVIFAIHVTGRWIRLLTYNQFYLDHLEAQKQPYILASWHQNTFFANWILRNKKLNALVSGSKDGNFAQSVMHHFGFQFSRGSSSKGGTLALQNMSNHLKEGVSAAITPDGPRGPKYKVQPGVVILSRMSGVPIIPWHFEASSQWILKSWDQHKIPKPYSYVISEYGSPIYVPQEMTSKEEVAEYCLLVEKQMNLLQERVRRKIEMLAI